MDDLINLVKDINANTGSEYKPHSVLLCSKTLDIIGMADWTRFNNLQWYQRLWGNVNYQYKSRFLDIKGFTIKKDGDSKQA